MQLNRSLAWTTKLDTLAAVGDNNAESQVPSALKVSAGPEFKLVETSLQKRDAVVIGRAPDADVVIHDLKASRRHCQLTRKTDGFLLEDLGSRNGTLVNGMKITQPILLKANQTFQIGDTMFYLG